MTQTIEERVKDALEHMEVSVASAYDKEVAQLIRDMQARIKELEARPFLNKESPNYEFFEGGKGIATPSRKLPWGFRPRQG